EALLLHAVADPEALHRAPVRVPRGGADHDRADREHARPPDAHAGRGGGLLQPAGPGEVRAFGAARRRGRGGDRPGARLRAEDEAGGAGRRAGGERRRGRAGGGEAVVRLANPAYLLLLLPVAAFAWLELVKRTGAVRFSDVSFLRAHQGVSRFLKP